MAHDSSEHLRFDSRLATRRGWISEKDLEKQRASLPDLAENAEFLSEEGEEQGSEAQSAESDAGEAGVSEEVPAAVIVETNDESGGLPSL